MKYTLYHYWRSSSSWRVRLALAHKNLPTEFIAVNLLKKEQNSQEFLKLNPNGFVPVLQMTMPKGNEKSALFESMSIMEFLEQNHPQNPIFFNDKPFLNCQLKALCQMIVSGIQPFQNLTTLQHIESLGHDKIKWAKKWIEDGFFKLEKHFQNDKPSCEFAFANHLTALDFCLIPQIYNAKRFGVNLNAFKKIYKLENTYQSLKIVTQTHPDAYQE